MKSRLLAILLFCGGLSGLLAASPPTPRYAIFETAFEAASAPANPYTAIRAAAWIFAPDGVRSIPLFWDGGKTWKLRISPDQAGAWSYRIESNDSGLDGRTGRFMVTASDAPGGVRVSARWPNHFERQNGEPFWFLGDTAWGYFLDNPPKQHARAQAEAYARTRAAQGFNAIHCMLLSEEGDGNNGGPPFHDLSQERINPAYWQEVDRRLSFANRQGLTVGLALAWGDKRKKEPYAWSRFPSPEARKRYARYIAARYSAYNVYFLVAGEWHAEIRTRPNAVEEQVFREFVEIGGVLAASDPHGRMCGIHPMTRHGSVREFASAAWMSFADYQQNYRNLHAAALLSRKMRGPVVNSEYGYFLRDADGDGHPDKDNSYTVEDMRHASWDIVMAGAYLVTGFGTTYFAGHRDPGPFDADAPKNRIWAAQIGHIKKFFEGLEWWRLAPADELLTSKAARTPDFTDADPVNPKRSRLHPPKTVYWAMAAPGETYILYVRGTTEPVRLDLAAHTRPYRVRQFDPRTGAYRSLEAPPRLNEYTYQAPDTQDWVVLLEAEPEGR